MLGTTSGIREKHRSSALKQLARERALKRSADVSALDKDISLAKDVDEARKKEREEEEEERNRLEQERRLKRARQSSNSLLTILPEPKNSKSFATVRLDKLMEIPEGGQTDESAQHVGDIGRPESPVNRLTEDGMIEVDVSKMINDMPDTIKELTIEKIRPIDIGKLSNGKEKEKNQITHLARLAVATELSLKEKAAQGRANKAAARSKYGW